MTAKDYKKAFKQLENKPAKMAKFIKHNSPKLRTCGLGRRKCRRCGRYEAHIQKYDLGYCRQCFREVATSLGFKKYS